MDGPVKLLWIQWGVMVFAQLLIPTVLVSLGQPSGDPVITYVPLGMVVPELLFAMVGVPMLFKHVPAQTAYIIRWAMLTSVALFGAVSGFLGASPLLVVAVVMVAVGCMAVTRPTADAYTAWEMNRLADD